MAYEILLGVAGLCVAGVIVLAVVEVPRWRKATPGYQPRHTAEQPRIITPVAHVGATEAWSPIADIGPVGPTDARIHLANARAQVEYWRRQEARWLAEVAEQDAVPLTRALDALQASLLDRLRRAGHDHIKTAEIPRGDIRRILAAAHRGDAR